MTGGRARWYPLAVLLTILLGFLLRLYALDRQDIWGDEAFSIWLSHQELPQVVAGGSDTHPPLYPFLLYLWLPSAGDSPVGARFLSVLIGTLTVPTVFAIGRRAWGWAGGALAALLSAVSPILVYYSQETRMYGLVTLLSAASVYWASRAWHAERTGRPAPAYLLSSLAAAYTHYYAFFVLLAENLAILPTLARRRRWASLRLWLAMQGTIVVAYLPWLAVQSQFLSGKASARFEEWNLATAGRIAWQTLAAFGGGMAVSHWAAAGVGGLCLSALIVGVWALRRGQRPEAWLIAAYLALPLILAWAVNPIMPFFYARYLLLIAPAFYLLAAWGVVTLGRQWPPLGVAAALVLLAGSGYGLYGYYTDDNYLKGRYGEMMAHIQANARSGDGIILANQLQRPLFDYYRPGELAGQAYFLPRYEYPLEDTRTAAELEQIAARHPRLWLVRFGNPAEYDPNGTLTRWLATRGSKAYAGGWVDADLSLYVMAPAGTGRIQHPLAYDLGDQVRLVGYALSADQIAPGETLLLTLYWQALAPIEKRYTVFTHLLDASQKIQGQIDSEPQGGGLPTDRWTTGQIVQDNYALAVAVDARPGPHQIEVGLYLLATLGRLPVRDVATGALLGDRVLLGPVEVVAP